MRADQRDGRMSGAVLVAVLLGVSSIAGCGDSNRETTQTEAPPPVDTSRAPTQNPLAGGGPGVAPSPGIPTGIDSGSPVVEVHGVTMEAPARWVREVTTSTMRAAQFRVPPMEGEGGDATLVVFRDIGGSAEANIARWIGQVTDKPSPPVRKTVQTDGGLTIETVRMVGTYSVGSMMGGSGNPEPDTMFLGAVVTGNSDSYPVFIRLVGPRAAVEPQLGLWDELIGSIKRSTS